MRRLASVLASFVLIVLFGLSAAGLLYETPTAIASGAAGRHLVVDGTPLRVLQEGSGPDILMIHGSPGGSAFYSRIRPVNPMVLFLRSTSATG